VTSGWVGIWTNEGIRRRYSGVGIEWEGVKSIGFGPKGKLAVHSDRR
jgi:hypothetical protein